MAMPSLSEHATSAYLHLRAKVPFQDPKPGAGDGQAKNPFDGVTPDISVFGAKFNSGIVILLGAIWGLSIIAAAVNLVPAMGKFNAAKSHHDSDGITKGKEHVIKAWAILVAVVCVPLIVGAGVVLGNAMNAGGKSN